MGLCERKGANSDRWVGVWVWVWVCAGVCVCVCVRERKERLARERVVSLSLCVFVCVCVCVCVCVLQGTSLRTALVIWSSCTVACPRTHHPASVRGTSLLR